MTYDEYRSDNILHTLDEKYHKDLIIVYIKNAVACGMNVLTWCETDYFSAKEAYDFVKGLGYDTVLMPSNNRINIHLDVDRLIRSHWALKMVDDIVSDSRDFGDTSKPFIEINAEKIGQITKEQFEAYFRYKKYDYKILSNGNYICWARKT